MSVDEGERGDGLPREIHTENTVTIARSSESRRSELGEGVREMPRISSPDVQGSALQGEHERAPPVDRSGVGICGTSQLSRRSFQPIPECDDVSSHLMSKRIRSRLRNLYKTRVLPAERKWGQGFKQYDCNIFQDIMK